MKLELKHIAPYLPYGLMWYKPGYPIVKQTQFDTDVDYHEFSLKPVLRSLSDFTKEIEHNGKKLIPAEEFFYEVFSGGEMEGNLVKDRVEDEDNKATYYYELEVKWGAARGSFFVNVYKNGATEDCVDHSFELSYWLFQMLLEWHFDVFNLIEQGLAVDINTLKTQGNPSGSY